MSLPTPTTPMLVQDIMQRPVVTTEAGTSLAAAYRLMQEHDIRHLPVLDGGRLVGLVTDRDLRFLTRKLGPAPFNAEDRVDHVMTTYPITAGPLDPVEEAAWLMRTRKIGCLPVLEGDALAGIVTTTDLFDAFLRLTGVAVPGARLVVTLDDTPALARLTTLVAEHDVPVHSMLSYPEEEEENARLLVILRVGTLNPAPLARAFRQAGFAVAWPVDKRAP